METATSFGLGLRVVVNNAGMDRAPPGADERKAGHVRKALGDSAPCTWNGGERQIAGPSSWSHWRQDGRCDFGLASHERRREDSCRHRPGEVSDTADAKSRFHRTPEQFVAPQPTRFDTAPQDIPIVINTYLHIDHCGGNEYFKKARLLVQKRELEYALNPLPVHRPFYGLDIAALKFEDSSTEKEIASGVKVILTPGHSPGSQSVLVDTAKGLYVLAADTITHFENMAVPDGHSFWPGPIYVDLGAGISEPRPAENPGRDHSSRARPNGVATEDVPLSALDRTIHLTSSMM